DPVSPPVTAPPAPAAAPPRATAADPPPKPADGPPLLEALHCLLKKQPEEARRWLERYEPPNRDLLRGLLVLAARLSEEPIARADPQDVAAVLNELEGMQEPLRPRAALALGAMRFCKWIEKYGDFDPLPDNHQFRAGDLVQVYVELRNFTSARQGGVY